MDFKLSAIVPVYNVEPFIAECIRSIKSQTFSDFELIIVNDVSTDKSIEICIKELTDSNINWKIINREKNGGLSAARNTGINESRGEYLCFIDSDDWIHPLMFELLIENADTEGAEVVCCNYTLEYKNSSVPSEYSVSNTKYYYPEKDIDLLFYMKEIIFIACARVFKKALFIENEIEFPLGVYYEDLATVFELFVCSKKIVVIPDFLYCYRQRRGSIMTKKDIKTIMDRFLLEENVMKVINKHSLPQMKSLDMFKVYNYFSMLRHLLLTDFIDFKENYLLSKKIMKKYIIQSIHIYKTMSKIEGVKLLLKSKYLFYHTPITYLFLRKAYSYNSKVDNENLF